MKLFWRNTRIHPPLIKGEEAGKHMECLDIMDIKQNNIKSIMNVLRENNGQSGMTKKEIADKTGLSFATVSNLCNELLERCIVESVKRDAASVGRTPFSVSFAYNRFRTICLNLQMQSVLRLAVLNAKNEMIFCRLYDITSLDKPEEVIRFAKEKFDEYVQEEGDVDCTYIGVGAAVSGIFDLATQTLVNCAVKMYEGVCLKEIVEQEFGLPGYVDNESNLCALSLKNRIPDCKNLVYLHFSEGVGVGIICNGSLLKGHHGYGGEVSYIPLGDKSKYCGECDTYGCIENDLSIPGIVRNYFGMERKDTLEAWKEFAEAVSGREERAMSQVSSIAGYLGELIALLIFIMDPEYVYVGGELAQIYDTLFQDMNKIIRKKCFMYGNRRVNIVKDIQSDMTINSGINEFIYSHWMV